MKPRYALVALVVFVAGVILWFLVSKRDPPARLQTTEVSRSTEEPEARSAVADVDVSGVDATFAAPSETVRDERLREQLRAALARVFADRGSALDAGATPSSASATTALGNLDPNYIRQRIRGDFIPMASRCYDLLLSRRPGFAGRMVLRFRITAHEQLGGIVEEVSVAPARDGDAGDADADASLDAGARSVFGDDAFETCVRESMMTVAFAPPERGGSLSVSYPIGLSPDEPPTRDAAR